MPAVNAHNYFISWCPCVTMFPGWLGLHLQGWPWRDDHARCQGPNQKAFLKFIVINILYVLAAAWHIFRESLWEAKDMSEKKMTITEDHSNVIQSHWRKTLLESISWFSTSLTCPTCFSYFGGHRIEIRSGEPEGSSRGIVAWRSDSCLQWSGRKIVCNRQKALISLFLMDHFVGTSILWLT